MQNATHFSLTQSVECAMALLAAMSFTAVLGFAVIDLSAIPRVLPTDASARQVPASAVPTLTPEVTRQDTDGLDETLHRIDDGGSHHG
jgi:hypothetical protein